MGQVVERAQLVRHRMADPQKCIGKRHTGHGGGIGHFLTGNRVMLAVVIGAGQIFKDHLESAQCQTVGIVGGHDGGIGFQRVRNGVNAGGAGQPLGGGHVEVGVDDGHVGHQLIVGQRVLDAGVLIGDDGEGGHLTAGTGRGGNGDEIGLFAHLREGVGALADIHEAHGHIHKVDLGVFIHHPHDLTGVHGRAAAQRNDAVGLEGRHLRGALLGAGQRRVGLNVIERGVLNAHGVQLIRNGLGIAVVVQEAVRHQKNLFLAQYGAQLIQRNVQAAFFQIYLLRCAEPQHVFSPLAYGLDVQQVLAADVFRNAVAAPRAAAQRQRGNRVEVVQIAQTAMRRGRVDHNAAGLHAGGKLLQTLAIRNGVQINGGGVAIAAVGDQTFGLVQRIRKIGGAVHGQHGRQLFVGKLLAQLHALHFADQDLGVLRHGHACQAGNGHRPLADDTGIQRAVDQNGFANLFLFILIQEIAAAGGKFLAHGLIHAVQHNDRLLRSTDHAVVKGLGVNDRVDGQQNVGGVGDNGGGVARADAQCRFAAGIGCLDHAGAARRQNNIRFLHQQVGHFQAGHIDPVDDTGRGACSHGGFQNHTGGGGGALLGARVRADQDAVAGLQGQQSLEDGGRGGVGGGNDRRDHTDGLGNFLSAHGRVFFNDTAGLDILIIVVNIFGRVVVFDDLILHNAHAGFSNGLLGQRQTLLVGGQGGGTENDVDLLLRIGGKDLLGGTHAGKRLLQAFHAVNDGTAAFLIHSLLLFS